MKDPHVAAIIKGLVEQQDHFVHFGNLIGYRHYRHTAAVLGLITGEAHEDQLTDAGPQTPPAGRHACHPWVQEPVAWLPMDTAPKDGTHVFLQVEFEDHAMEDGPAPQQTIGSNTSENDGGPDEWQFAGWDWVHDRYTQGVGTPVSWLPKTALPALVQQPAMQEPECYKWEEYCKWAKGWGWDTCESEYDPRLPEYAKYHEGTDFDGPNVKNFRALYTAPQAPQPAPVQEPLCKWPTCQTEKYQQDLADQIAKELVGEPRKAVKLSEAEVRSLAKQCDEGGEDNEYLLALSNAIQDAFIAKNRWAE